MPGFVALDGEIYAVTAGYTAVTTIVASANKLAEINGAVNFELSWDMVESRWRRKTVQDIVPLRINGQVTIDEVEFKQTTIGRLMNYVNAGSGKTYGPTPASNATYFALRSSTAPKMLQMVFHFKRSSDNKIMQIYCPKVMVDNFPMPFAVDDFVKQNLTFRIMASTNGNFMTVAKQS